MGFSKDFLRGAAMAAAQAEDARDEDGKASGIRDCLHEGHMKHGESPHEADGFCHRVAGGHPDHEGNGAEQFPLFGVPAADHHG